MQKAQVWQPRQRPGQTLCTGVTPPVARGGGIGRPTSALISAGEALSHCDNCSTVSWEQHTSVGISGDGSYHALCSPVPASAPVCVTEYLPLIAEGLALHPLFLLPSQPSMCTLLHKFNLNQMEKKGCIKKPRNGIWIFQVQQRMQRIIEQSGAKGRWTSALFISQVQWDFSVFMTWHDSKAVEK